MEVAPLMG